MKVLLTLLIGASSLTASPFTDFQSEPKIAVHNSIITKVNGKTISMMDVKKKMDMLFHQHYPQMSDNNQARFQFYDASWRYVLRDMIDNELIISDALDKEIKLTDGEVREEMGTRFGPKVMETLDKIDLTYKEAWDMVKNEMIVQRMTWWFVHSKATSKITPQDIRQAYCLYVKEHPAYSERAYRVVSVRSEEESEALASEVHKVLVESGKTPELLQESLKEFENEGLQISISNKYVAKTEDLSEVHRTSLETLSPGSYSEPTYQFSRRDRKNVYRIFYLVGKNDFPAPAFEGVTAELKNQLIQKASMKESDEYITKLRKHYGFDGKDLIPEGLNPFSLQ